MLHQKSYSMMERWRPSIRVGMSFSILAIALAYYGYQSKSIFSPLSQRADVSKYQSSMTKSRILYHIIQLILAKRLIPYLMSAVTIKVYPTSRPRVEKEVKLPSASHPIPSLEFIISTASKLLKTIQPSPVQSSPVQSSPNRSSPVQYRSSIT